MPGALRAGRAGEIEAVLARNRAAAARDVGCPTSILIASLVADGDRDSMARITPGRGRIQFAAGDGEESDACGISVITGLLGVRSWSEPPRPVSPGMARGETVAVRERDASWLAYGGFISVAAAGCAVLPSSVLAAK